MHVTTNLPVSPMFFKHWHTDETEVGVVLVKASFVRRTDGGFRSDGAPPEICMDDVFDGDDISCAPLAQEQDLAPGKRGTDLIINAIARSPDGKAMTDWAVRAEIENRLSYGFQVRGPSEWRSGFTGWKLTAPELVNEVPITYALAYGGSAPSGDDDTPDEIFEFNPAGIGHTNSARIKAREAFAAPQIGDIAEFITADPSAEMTVHGTRPIAKAWLPRRGFAGTFDGVWQRERHPRMPKNYSLQFWNTAPTALQLADPLLGTEVVRLTGMSHSTEAIEIPLPAVALYLSAVKTDETAEAIEMDLDTVQIDVTDTDTNAHKLTLIWRVIIKQPAEYLSATVGSKKLEK